MRYTLTVLLGIAALAIGYRLLAPRLEPQPFDGVIIDRCVDVDPYHPGKQMYEVVIGPGEPLLDGGGPWSAPVTEAAYFKSDSLPIGRHVHFRFNNTIAGEEFARIVP